MKEEVGICIGNTGSNGCGYVGGMSGDTCSNCGGMILTPSSIDFADQMAKEWTERDGKKS